MVTCETIPDRTVRLGRALQSLGVAVSLSEILDATRSTAQIDLLSRTELREALRATLVKDARHYAAFEREFDRCFPVHTTRSTAGSGDVVAAVATGDGLATAAAALVDQHGGLEGVLRSERHHVQRVFHGADIARLMSRVRIVDPSLTPDQLRARIDELKRLVADDVRSRVAGDAGGSIDPDLRDLDFLAASRSELDDMRRAIRPIARRLAARLARRQRHRTGRANMRRTIRRSLGTGGVPVDVAYDRPRVHRPELLVLCDISGSVADASLFTLTLMSALSAEVARTRSFVFVDAVDEVTDLLGSTGHGIEPWQLMRNTNAIRGDGHSHYGDVFEQFWDETASACIGRTTTVIVTGDARTNYRPSGAHHLARIAERARRVYWLNPEPQREWDTLDSEMRTYAAFCNGAFEVRNLRQLVDTIERIV